MGWSAHTDAVTRYVSAPARGAEASAAIGSKKATPGSREGLPGLVAVSPARPADDATSVSISRMYSSPCSSRTIFAARQAREIQATGLVDPPPGVTPMRHRNVRPDWTCRGPPHGPVEQMQPARRLTTRILNFIQSGQSIYSFPKLGNGYSESRSNWQRYAAAAQHANGGVNPVQLYVCVGLGFNSRRSNRATAGSVAHGGDAVVHISSDCQRRHDHELGAPDGPGSDGDLGWKHVHDDSECQLATLQHGFRVCSAITRSRHRGRQQIVVMQATQHRSGAHPEGLADAMAGLLCRRRHDLRWRVRHAWTERHVRTSVVVMTHP